MHPPQKQLRKPTQANNEKGYATTAKIRLLSKFELIVWIKVPRWAALFNTLYHIDFNPQILRIVSSTGRILLYCGQQTYHRKNLPFCLPSTASHNSTIHLE